MSDGQQTGSAESEGKRFPLPSELLEILNRRVTVEGFQQQAETGAGMLKAQAGVYALMLAETLTRRNSVSASFQAMLEDSIKNGTPINPMHMGMFRTLLAELDKTSKIALAAMQAGTKIDDYMKKAGGETPRQEA